MTWNWCGNMLPNNGNQIGVVVAEEIGKFQKFFGVASKPRKFGKD